MANQKENSSDLFGAVMGSGRGRIVNDVLFRNQSRQDRLSARRLYEEMLSQVGLGMFDNALFVMSAGGTSAKDNEYVQSLLDGIGGLVISKRWSEPFRHNAVSTIMGFRFYDSKYVRYDSQSKVVEDRVHLVSFEDGSHGNVVCGHPSIGMSNIASDNEWGLNHPGICTECKEYHYKALKKAFKNRKLGEREFAFSGFLSSVIKGDKEKGNLTQEVHRQYFKEVVLEQIKNKNVISSMDLDGFKEDAYWKALVALWRLEMNSRPEKMLFQMLGRNASKKFLGPVQRMTSQGVFNSDNKVNEILKNVITDEQMVELCRWTLKEYEKQGADLDNPDINYTAGSVTRNGFRSKLLEVAVPLEEYAS